ncbi:hypothetical protein GOODEAATRI_012530 [Goodea atripinnis]|uniref:Uncharacterized protein n=1 Tax=Goodea atripinnis TaxID=208336 RepID=A0ABV0MH83_9TELE
MDTVLLWTTVILVLVSVLRGFKEVLGFPHGARECFPFGLEWFWITLPGVFELFSISLEELTVCSSKHVEKPRTDHSERGLQCPKCSPNTSFWCWCLRPNKDGFILKIKQQHKLNASVSAAWIS